MQRCLQLAALGAGQVAPNPMVGAVLVYDERITGEGYHQHYGEAHAEVNCINSVPDADKTLIPLSTLYVSLEPCAHFGKTPPCADLIIRHKIPNVIIGCRDSFEAVDGRGIEKLKAASIHVTVGILEKESLELNRRFFTFHERRRPYIILKWAQTSDKKTGGPGTERIFISNEITSRLVHKWRAEEAAILVGTNTALQDDPSLTTRYWPGNNPLRLVIDKELKLPMHLKLFDGSVKTIVFNSYKKDEKGNLIYSLLNKEQDIPEQILAALYNMQVQSVIVEGGTKLLQSFIDAGLWDEARVITNTAMKIENGQAAPDLDNSILLDEQHVKSDTVTIYKKGPANK